MRLLNSINLQSFRDFEVVMTDDSPDNELAQLAEEYQSLFQLQYFKNEQPAGSPANWNRAIAMAKGEWIKIMHDDDWFVDATCLEQFAMAAKQTESSFIFSGFVNVNLETGVHNVFVISQLQEKMLRQNPLYLFRTNYIGHPSTTLIRNNQTEWFDESIKWVVDFEFYIRLLRKEKKFYAIRQPLIKIGIGAEQITTAVFRKKEVEIPENLYLLSKLGEDSLRYFFVYDYYWRLMRNLKITTVAELEQFAQLHQVPQTIKNMIRWQQKLGLDALGKYGAYSKLSMGFHYILYRAGLL